VEAEAIGVEAEAVDEIAASTSLLLKQVTFNIFPWPLMKALT